MFKQLLLISFIVLPGYSYAQQPAPLIVHFAFNSDRLSVEASAGIDRYFAATHPGDTVLLSGYTDSIGTFTYNEKLSVRRAFTVKEYLVAKGLAAAGRIKITGFGDRYPVAENGSDSGRAANRRVEIISGSTGAATRSKRTLYDVIMDSSIAVGTTLPLRDVNFFPGRHLPFPASDLILDELVRAMQVNTRLQIRIEGHICCMPDDTDGLDEGTGQPNLSVERAKYVYDYLAARGVAKSRMSYAGYGASGKLYPYEQNEVERSGNRRVEIRIVAK